VAQRACPQAACERALPPSCAEQRHAGHGRSAVRAVQVAAQAASQQATTRPAPGSGAAGFQSSSVLQLRGSRCASMAAGGTCVNRSVRFGLGRDGCALDRREGGGGRGKRTAGHDRPALAAASCLTDSTGAAWRLGAGIRAALGEKHIRRGRQRQTCTRRVLQFDGPEHAIADGRGAR
jgi:hypothetical protein